MFENSTTEEIINVLEPLIEEGRLTGTGYLDGVLLFDTDSQGVVDAPVSLYDEWGFSVADEFGCVRIQKVDERIAAWLASDNKFRVKTAKEQSQYFGILVPGADLSDEVQERLMKNTAYHSFMSGRGGMVIDPFRHYNSRYIHLDTGETKDKLNDTDRRSHRWGINKAYQGDVIPNHSSVAWGKLARPDHPSWATRFVPAVTKTVFSLMNRKANALRKQAELEASGRKAPTPESSIGKPR